MSEDQRILPDLRRWAKQESAWDDHFYVGPTVGIEKPTGASLPSSAARAVEVTAPVIAIPNIARSSTGGSKAARLQALYERYKACVACPLGPTRIQFVFGVGSADAQVLFIGEGPGYEEDRRGEPFIGKAGQLLDKIMASIGLSRGVNAYIANIVKCHPMVNPQTPEARGNDRPPTPEEVLTCSPILQQQVAILQPKVIVTLGSPSTKAILRTSDGITKLRGSLVPFPVETFFVQSADLPTLNPVSTEERDALRSTQVLPTYHPAALLRNPDLKADVWTDMKLLRTLIAG